MATDDKKLMDAIDRAQQHDNAILAKLAAARQNLSKLKSCLDDTMSIIKRSEKDWSDEG